MAARNNEFQIFVKPAGAHCNLACRYCYYINKKDIYPSSTGRIMEYGILERYISQHITESPGDDIFFSWHGGEPALAGIDFFRKAVTLQKKYKSDRQRISNGIQTNGTLINEDWCRFLAEEDFYVGISVDGTEKLHNRSRIYSDGRPSFRKTIEGLKMIQKYGIKTELLCVVNSINVKFPLEVYRFLKEQGSKFITFLPLVEKDPLRTVMASEISVQAPDWGRFLCTIFDEWLSEDIGTIKIQIIEEALRTAFSQDHTLCIFKTVCGGVPVVEHNGDFYSCDHFVDSGHLIGNINTQSLGQLLNDERQINFGNLKKETLPGYCRECEVLSMCNGECPKNRFMHTPSGEPGLNYLCPGYRMFFNHIIPFTNAVKAEWQQARDNPI